MVFWFGIGVAASSRLYLLAWLLTLTVRLIRYRAEKKRWHQGIREIPGIRERRSAGNQKSSIAT
jgi:hypothetical protein